MKISTLQENLKHGLSLVGHLAGKNINLPILNNILIEARDGVIKLISTNLEIGITCLVRGKIETEGAHRGIRRGRRGNGRCLSGSIR